MIPHAFALDFTVPPITLDAIILDAPPAFKLTPPDAGWIRLMLAGYANGKPVNSHIRLSYVYPPLADIWLWSRALAANLTPARVRIDEEGIASELRAEPEADDSLRVSLQQEDTEGEPHTLIVWHEPRADFLARWGACFAKLFHDDTQPWEEWEHFYDAIWREPARSLPWEKLAQTRVKMPSNWPRNALIAWFWLLHAHHYRSERATEWSRRDPLVFAREDIQFDALRLRCAAAAWRAAIPAHVPPDASAYAASHEELCEWLEDTAPLLSEIPPTPVAARSLFEHTYPVSRAVHDWIQLVEAAVFACLPLCTGQIFIDEHHARGVVLEAENTTQIVVWETGAVTVETGFNRGSSTVWRWPVSDDTPHLFPLELPDALACFFALAPVLCRWPTCPCCGYPPLDDDQDEIQDCELCGWPVWLVLHDPPPAPNDPGDDECPSLRECRTNFQTHGDIWPLENTQEDVTRFRSQQSAQARQACIDDWNRWIADPARSAETLPDPVWVRVRRMEGGE